MTTRTKPHNVATWMAFLTNGSVTIEYRRDHPYNDIRTGVGLPNHRDLIRKCQSATTAFSAQKGQTFTNGPHVWSMTRKYFVPAVPSETLGVLGDPAGHYAHFGIMTFPSSSLDSEADAIALQIFISKARSVQTKMSGLTFIGELAEAVHMIHDRGKSLFFGVGSYLSALKKGRRLPALHRRNFLENLWLEYSFGWRPLYKDISDAAKAYSELGKKRRVTLVSGTGYAHKSKPSGVSELSINQFWGHFMDIETFDTKVRYLGAVKGQSSGMELHAAMKLFGLQPAEFLPTAWELIPWSFLVDYFLNIQNIVQGVVFDTTSLAWSCKTIRRERLYATSFVPSRELTVSKFGSLYKLRDWNASPSSFSALTSNVVRSTPASFVPSLQFRFPGLKTQWLNMAALAASHKRLRPYY